MNPSSQARRAARGATPRRSQQGVVLFISLIVMVAMTLAGIALMRSVDTAVVVAGNMAFKQAAISVADRGTQEATSWLLSTGGGAALQATDESKGYYSSNPVGGDPDWFDINSWSDAVMVNGGAPDASGNVVRYLVHRMCTLPDLPYNGNIGLQANDCGLYFPASTGTSGGSMAVGSPLYIGTPQIYYRITTRVDGPRDTVSIIQSSVLIDV
jgi:Tfp pilus assembly protein PilX